MGNSLYGGWRTKPFPTLYPSNKTPVTADVLESGFIFAACILAISFLVVLPGVRGIKRIYTLIRVLLSIFIVTSIMMCNFGQEWEVSEIHTKTQYRAGISDEIEANIGVKIGLRSINITLRNGHVVYEERPDVVSLANGQVNETVNYNERFHWDNLGFHIGRAGFGPFAGQFNQEYREGQWKGLPYPILWIAEYFTLDGEGIRWGRHYLQAGFYSHIMLWTAFPLWILALITFPLVIRWGGYFSLCTGGCMIIAVILFATIRNANELIIPFEDARLVFHWGWCFWLCLVTGIICLVIGVIITIMDLRFPEYLSTFFGVDITQDLEEFYVDALEIQTHAAMPKKGKSRKHGNVLVSSKATYGQVKAPDMNSNGGASANQPDDDDDDDDDYENPPPKPNVQRMFRKKTIMGPLQKSLKKRPRPPPRKPPAAEPDEDIYENQPSRVRFNGGGNDNVAFEAEVKVQF